jgi:hypothetical protein
MARAPTPVARDESESPALLPASEKVTYTPGPGDSPDTIWMRHKFKAHVPKEVRDATLIEKARANKFFHVGEFDPEKHAYKEVVAEPKTAEAYRAWCVNWLRGVEDVEHLCERWANEAKMRARLEVGYDDFKYIASLLQPRLDDLIRREDEPRQVRDKLIRNNELADLELQIAGVGQSAA